MTQEALSVFSPLPPEQNGIADYTYHLLNPLSSLFDCAAFVDDPHALAPPGVSVRDQLQAFRFLGIGSKILHQIGNNPGHIFVLNALRKWGGVTTLHDQNLHYLYEAAGADMAVMAQGMTAAAPKMGAAYARHWQQTNLKTKANYVLFDMLKEVLSVSSALVVHSHFARRRLALLYGAKLTQRVVVIPHLALPFEACSQEEAAERLKTPPGVPLILTSGFATPAKRFDWLITALEEIALRGTDFFWVHAGKERPDEFDLSGLLKKHPTVKQRTLITGYLTEEDLSTYICACDLLVNLRFPSVGESSGTLARAMSASKCCIVSDTAAYSDLPKDSVMHVPITNTIPRLVETLEALLQNPTERQKIGNAARALVDSEWAPDIVARAYADVLLAQSASTSLRSGPDITADSVTPIRIALEPITTAEQVMAALDPSRGKIEIIFEVRDTTALATLSLARPKLLTSLLPPSFMMSSFRLESEIADEDAATPGLGTPAPIILLRVKGVLQ